MPHVYTLILINHRQSSESGNLLFFKCFQFSLKTKLVNVLFYVKKGKEKETKRKL